MRKQTSVFEAVIIIITPGVSHFIHKIKKSPACNIQNLVVGDVVFFVFQTKDQLQCHSCSDKNSQQFQSSYTTAISRETSGENLKEECVTQLSTASQKGIFFFPYLTKI